VNMKVSAVVSISGEVDVESQGMADSAFTQLLLRAKSELSKLGLKLDERIRQITEADRAL